VTGPVQRQIAVTGATLSGDVNPKREHRRRGTSTTGRVRSCGLHTTSRTLDHSTPPVAVAAARRARSPARLPLPLVAASTEGTVFGGAERVPDSLSISHRPIVDRGHGAGLRETNVKASGTLVPNGLATSLVRSLTARPRATDRPPGRSVPDRASTDVAGRRDDHQALTEHQCTTTSWSHERGWSGVGGDEAVSDEWSPDRYMRSRSEHSRPLRSTSPRRLILVVIRRAGTSNTGRRHTTGDDSRCGA